ncbi:MAG: hypothetical protein JWR50_3015 [Mucilaginibacter sp.]|nr:hypothetical protein [Mucilaginibacter sp.]
MIKMLLGTTLVMKDNAIKILNIICIGLKYSAVLKPAPCFANKAVLTSGGNRGRSGEWNEAEWGHGIAVAPEHFSSFAPGGVEAVFGKNLPNRLAVSRSLMLVWLTYNADNRPPVIMPKVNR